MKNEKFLPQSVYFTIKSTSRIILTFTHFLLPYKTNEMDPITSKQCIQFSPVYSVYIVQNETSGFEF